ncbi:His-Xaa-Ser repeat protein HxsA2 [Polynucleobacter rarus]|uniref:His-Xaa-Ser repeat protein HxsA2 n=1 Tax=Polynucleobacter rarus TaxID=556055 RepID=UPI000D3E3E14|nr:His-Xaa-Ser repeat protein HxsA2 [Polynucleobacter rarus]
MSIKKYLVPLTTLIATMPMANANVPNTPSLGESKTIKSAEDLQSIASTKELTGNLFKYSKGTELHSLVVKPNEIGEMLAYHYSHSSHSSHRSHYSSR